MVRGIVMDYGMSLFDKVALQAKDCFRLPAKPPAFKVVLVHGPG